MPFERLKDSIKKLTFEYKHPLPSVVNRNFYILFSSDMEKIKKGFEYLFPAHYSDFENLYNWLMFDSADNFAEIFREKLIQSFDAEVSISLERKGKKIIDNRNQIFFISELLSKENLERLLEALGICKSEIERGRFSNFFWIGIFIIGTKDKDNIISMPKDLRKEFQSNLKSYPFNRIFFIDIQNSLEMILRSKDEQYSIIWQLLYFLNNKALTSEMGRYEEWLNTNPASQEYITSFSSITYFYPIDEIIETVSLDYGREVVKKAIFETPPSEIPDLCFWKFVNDNKLNTLDEIIGNLSQYKEYSTVDPLREIPEPSFLNLKNYSQIIDFINNSLPLFAERNENLMRQILNYRIYKIKAELREFVKYINSEERIGLQASKEFLRKLKEHFEKLKPQSIPPPTTQDISEIIESMKIFVAESSRPPAVIIRTLLLLIFIAIFLFNFKLGLINKIISFVLSFLILGGLSFLHMLKMHKKWNSFKKIIEDTLKKNWYNLSKNYELRLANEFIDRTLMEIEEIGVELENVNRRILQLYEYFGKYPPPQISEYTLWKSLITKEKLIEFKDKITPNIDIIVEKYLKKYRPLSKWERFAPPDGREPEAWEYKVFENASEEILPDTAPLLKMNILSIFNPNNDKNFHNEIRAMIRAVQPYIKLKPGSQVTKNGFLESKDDEYKSVTQEITKNLKPYFNDISVMASPSSYRITFYALMEGIRFDNVILEKEG